MISGTGSDQFGRVCSYMWHSCYPWQQGCRIPPVSTTGSFCLIPIFVTTMLQIDLKNSYCANATVEGSKRNASTWSCVTDAQEDRAKVLRIGAKYSTNRPLVVPFSQKE